MVTVYRGTVLHTKSFDEFEVFDHGFIAVDNNGKIIGLGKNYASWLKQYHIPAEDLSEVRLNDYQFIMPGLVDCHIHAPQYAQLGLGLDMPLLDWLNTYTFPLEAKFSNRNYAEHVYRGVVESTIRCGTTLASYFATNHLDSTLILAEEALRQGQRALIGKVCSNCNSPDYYVEKTSDSISSTELFVKAVRELKSPLILPTITPRFALSCTKDLLTRLGSMAKRLDVHIQSHISENLAEIDAVKGIFKTGYAAVYDNASLLTKKTVLAHGVHLEDAEIALIKERGTAIAHCPASNTMLSSGICDVQRLINAGVTVGLGTDCAGGNSVSIQNAMLRTLEVSKHLEFFNKQHISGSAIISQPNPLYKPLKYTEALYLATLGGAKALALDHVTGNFVEGKEFDALLIDVSIGEKPNRTYNATELLEKFIFSGDDRNVRVVFVAGKIIKGYQK
ncbi:guanine deaminase [Scaptodrosophila lebanonensis]|uniref:Guanine deaminase n=1 Tax=Drosophila lebanonensis TaxID=7225 RepID=A0A6J2TCG8_DROLE|nr:guanine deaminase [Scaptodrosophila lebanonensis]